jgi:hypothetical protein
MYRSTTLIALLATTVLTAGCGDDPPPLVAPTPPVSISEEFTGTLTPFSARIHAFVAVTAGQVSATLTEIDQPDPNAATVVGLDLGTWTGVFCQVTIARPSTIQGGVVNGTATTAGSLCVRIYDVSDTGLPAAVNYKLSVTHF